MGTVVDTKAEGASSTAEPVASGDPFAAFPSHETEQATESDDRSAGSDQSAIRLKRSSMFVLEPWTESDPLPHLSLAEAERREKASQRSRRASGRNSLLSSALRHWQWLRPVAWSIPRRLRESGQSLVREAWRRTLVAANRERAHRRDVRMALAGGACVVAVGLGLLVLTPPATSIETSPLQTSIARSADAPVDAPISPPEVSSTPVPPAPPVPGTHAAGGTDAATSTREAGTRVLPAQNLPEANAPSPTEAVSQVVRTTGVGEAERAIRAQTTSAAGIEPSRGRGWPYRGSLAVKSSPEGAQVFVNGIAVGSTPLLLRDVPVGSRVVRVELEGHERWSAQVRVVANVETLTVADLRRSPTQ